MKLKYPIYIPSKGRSKNVRTAILLKESNIDFYIVVEPQDYKDYQKYFSKKNILVLNKNDKGMAYVRNFCVKHARKAGHSALWQLDDDILKYKIRKDSKRKETTAYIALSKLERIMDKYSNVGQVAHRLDAFAFAYKGKYQINRAVYSSVLMRTNLPVKYRNDTIEDSDFSLQLLYTHKWCTIITNRVTIQTVPHNKQNGGLTEKKKGLNKRSQYNINYANAWPGHFTLKEREDGTIHIVAKRFWSKFVTKPKSVKK